MDDGFEHLFIGKTRMYEALRKAGVKRAVPQRNVPWVNRADDGDTIINVWRHSLRERRGTIYSDFALKKRVTRNPVRRAKREELMRVLSGASGATVRVVLLDERKPNSGLTNGCKYDPVKWSVHDLGDRYELRRGGRGTTEYLDVPIEPGSFGVLNPRKQQRASQQIERLGRVKRVTLERAGYRCEIPDCKDAHQFVKPDVHHITRLGNAGADHTDNTVALCPACHARIHRGIRSVMDQMEAAVDRIRRQHLKSRSKRRP
jgi:hypothetical protein